MQVIYLGFAIILLQHNVKSSSPPTSNAYATALDGDVQLTAQQKQQLSGNGQTVFGSSSNKEHLWPGGVIPYEIDCSLSKNYFLFFICFMNWRNHLIVFKN